MLRTLTDAMFPGLATIGLYTAPGQISVFGIPPINRFSTLIAAVAIVPRQATVGTGGSIPAGDYVLSLVQVDTNGRKSRPSNRISARVLSGSSTITIDPVTFDAGAVSWQLYIETEDEADRQYPVATDVVANPVTVSDLLSYTGYYDGPGLPDQVAHHLRVIVTPIRHGGIFGVGSTAVAAHSITLPVTSTLNKWAGRILSQYGSQTRIDSGGVGSAAYDGLYEGKVNSFDITANTTGGAMTVSQDTTGLVFAADDIWVMRAQANIASDTTIGDADFVNSLEPDGLSTDAESGKEVRIIKGLGKGQKRIAVGNDSTTLTVPKWDVNPDGTSVFIVLEPAPVLSIPLTEFACDGISLTDSLLATLKNIPFTTEGSQSFLVQMVTEDANGNASPIDEAPWMEIFVPKLPGGDLAQSLITTTPYDVQPTDDVLTFGAGASVVNLPALADVARHVIRFVNRSGSSLTLNPASGETIEGASSLTLQNGSSYTLIPDA